MKMDELLNVHFHAKNKADKTRELIIVMKRKKQIIMFLMAIFLLPLSACNGNRVWSENNTLYFNEPEVVDNMRVSRIRGTNVQVSEYDLIKIFPFIEASGYYWRGRVTYFFDNTLLWINLSTPSPDVQGGNIGISLLFLRDWMRGAPNDSLDPFMDNIIANFNFPYHDFRLSDMYGVLVRAVMVEHPLDELRFTFLADFVIDDIYFVVQFTDYKEAGQSRMNEIVSTLILSSPHDFSILEYMTILLKLQGGYS